MKIKMIILGCMLVLVSLSSAASALTLKIGSIEPTSGFVDNALRTMTADWQRIAGKAIEVKIYPGGIAGDEDTMLRKMRLGQLHGLVLDSAGLNLIEKGPLAVSVPFLIKTEAEVTRVLDKASSHFSQKIARKNFVMIAWAFTGWTYFFSRRPVIGPDDLKRQKLRMTDFSNQAAIWKSNGFQTVSSSIGDVLRSLSNGSIDAVLESPHQSLAYQFFGYAKYQCAVKISPRIVTLAISRTAWEKIPEHLRPRLIDAAKNTFNRITKEAIKEEANAVRLMKGNGLVVQNVPSATVTEWEKVMNNQIDPLVREAIGAESYTIIKNIVQGTGR